MPPHCDAIDGPVVRAARLALEQGDVGLALPYVPAPAEDEVRTAFEAARRARALGKNAADVADRWFFETVVRLHREGEGAPFTGLRPAGLDHGPVLPLAERAVDLGRADELLEFLHGELTSELVHRLAEVGRLRAEAGRDVAHSRRYVGAMLSFEVWAHTLHNTMLASPHEAHAADAA